VGGRNAKLAVLRSHDISLLWVGQLISVVGDWLLFVGLPFAVYIRTGSALAAGVFVDRWDRHRLRPLAEG
jgi:hypothetical protein